MGFINILYTINIQFKDSINPIVGTFSKWIDDHVTPGGEVAWQVPELNGPIWRVIAGIIIQ